MYYFKENTKGEETKFTTKLDYFIKNNILTFIFEALNSTFNSYSNIYNDAIYNGDVCEIFLQVKGRPYYYEFEIAPNETLFLAKIFNPYNDSSKMTSEFIEKPFFEGKIEKNSNNYIATIKIPLDKIECQNIDDLTFNAFRIETEGTKSSKNLLALNPTLCPSFHKTDKFIKL